MSEVLEKRSGSSAFFVTGCESTVAIYRKNIYNPFIEKCPAA